MVYINISLLIIGLSGLAVWPCESSPTPDEIRDEVEAAKDEDLANLYEALSDETIFALDHNLSPSSDEALVAAIPKEDIAADFQTLPSDALRKALNNVQQSDLKDAGITGDIADIPSAELGATIAKLSPGVIGQIALGNIPGLTREQQVALDRNLKTEDLGEQIKDLDDKQLTIFIGDFDKDIFNKIIEGEKKAEGQKTPE